MRKRYFIITFLIIVITSHYLLCQEIIRNKNDSKKKLYSDSIILQKELIIGSNIENEAPFFESVRSFRVDNNGNIYILDSKACRILKFNNSGDLILTIGKKGQGPGEFQLPFSLEFGRNDTLLIHDLRNQRLSYFNREDGRLIEEISTAKVYRLIRINDNSEGNFIGRMSLYGKESIHLKRFNFILCVSFLAFLKTIQFFGQIAMSIKSISLMQREISKKKFIKIINRLKLQKRIKTEKLISGIEDDKFLQIELSSFQVITLQ